MANGLCECLPGYYRTTEERNCEKCHQTCGTETHEGPWCLGLGPADCLSCPVPYCNLVSSRESGSLGRCVCDPGYSPAARGQLPDTTAEAHPASSLNGTGSLPIICDFTCKKCSGLSKFECLSCDFKMQGMCLLDNGSCRRCPEKKLTWSVQASKKKLQYAISFEAPRIELIYPMTSKNLKSYVEVLLEGYQEGSDYSYELSFDNKKILFEISILESISRTSMSI